MSRKRECGRGTDGFTLLELLISVAILSLILVTLSGGVRFAGAAWEREDARSTREGDVDAVQNALRQLISAGSISEGTATSLKFVGTLPAALARGGLFDIELRLSGGKLVLVWRQHFKGAADMGPRQTELASGIAALDLAYYVAPSGWQRNSDDGSPPELIRVSVAFAGNRAWPPLVIAPMLEAPGAMSDQ